jgi:hypothetical protein
MQQRQRTPSGRLRRCEHERDLTVFVRVRVRVSRRASTARALGLVATVAVVTLVFLTTAAETAIGNWIWTFTQKEVRATCQSRLLVTICEDVSRRPQQAQAQASRRACA